MGDCCESARRKALEEAAKHLEYLADYWTDATLTAGERAVLNSAAASLREPGPLVTALEGPGEVSAGSVR